MWGPGLAAPGPPGRCDGLRPIPNRDVDCAGQRPLWPMVPHSAFEFPAFQDLLTLRFWFHEGPLNFLSSLIVGKVSMPSRLPDFGPFSFPI